MRGEIAINVADVKLGNDAVRPYKDANISQIDLQIIDTQAESCWICGEHNDWGYLFVNALIPILRYGYYVERKIDVALQKYDGDPEVILVGKNEYRSLEILQKIRICRDEALIYKNIPIVKSSKINGIELFGHENKQDKWETTGFEF